MDELLSEAMRSYRPGTLNATEFRGADRTSFEHPARLLCLHGPQWQVDSLVPYCLLPLLAQDEVQEGRNRRIQRLAGGAVDVEIDEAGERIARERDILIVRRIERAVRILRDREGLYGGVDEGQSGVSQCIPVLRDVSRTGNIKRSKSGPCATRRVDPRCSAHAAV